jgi:hypothetical protein
MHYPLTKLMDMHFWETGYERELAKSSRLSSSTLSPADAGWETRRQRAHLDASALCRTPLGEALRRWAPSPASQRSELRPRRAARLLRTHPCLEYNHFRKRQAQQDGRNVE